MRHFLYKLRILTVSVMSSRIALLKIALGGYISASRAPGLCICNVI